MANRFARCRTCGERHAIKAEGCGGAKVVRRAVGSRVSGGGLGKRDSGTAEGVRGGRDEVRPAVTEVPVREGGLSTRAHVVQRGGPGKCLASDDAGSNPAGGTNSGKCEVCGGPLPVSLGKRPRVTCSGRCRTAKSR